MTPCSEIWSAEGIQIAANGPLPEPVTSLVARCSSEWLLMLSPSGRILQLVFESCKEQADRLDVMIGETNRPNGRQVHAPPQLHALHYLQQRPIGVHDPHHDQDIANQAAATRPIARSAHQELPASHIDPHHVQQHVHPPQGAILPHSQAPQGFAPAVAVTRGFHPVTHEQQKIPPGQGTQSTKFLTNQTSHYPASNLAEARKIGNRANTAAVTSPTGALSPERVVSPTGAGRNMPAADLTTHVSPTTRSPRQAKFSSQSATAGPRRLARPNDRQQGAPLTTPPTSPPPMRRIPFVKRPQQHERQAEGREAGGPVSCSGPAHVHGDNHCPSVAVKPISHTNHVARTSPPPHQPNFRLGHPAVVLTASRSPAAHILPSHIAASRVAHTHFRPEKPAHTRFLEENGLTSLTPRFYVSSFEYFTTAVSATLLPLAIQDMVEDTTREYICIAWRDHLDCIWPMEIMYRDRATGITRIDHIELSAEGVELLQMREHMGNIDVGVTEKHTWRHDERGLVLIQAQQARPLRGDVFKPVADGNYPSWANPSYPVVSKSFVRSSVASVWRMQRHEGLDIIGISDQSTGVLIGTVTPDEGRHGYTVQGPVQFQAESIRGHPEQFMNGFITHVLLALLIMPIARHASMAHLKQWLDRANELEALAN